MKINLKSRRELELMRASGRVVHVEAGAMTSEKDVAEAAQKYLGVGG